MPGKFSKRIGLQGEPNSVHHMPCGFLRNTQVARDLIAANAVLTTDQQPHRSQPFVEAKGGILKNCSDLYRELFSGVLIPAFPHASRGNEADVISPARRTHHTL